MDTNRFSLRTWRRPRALHQIEPRLFRFQHSCGRLLLTQLFLELPLSLRLAYPDGHTESQTDEDGEIEYLKQKIDAGADYIITQLFYDVDGFLRWEKKVRAAGMSYL